MAHRGMALLLSVAALSVSVEAASITIVDGTYRIVNQNSGLCVDVSGSGTGNSAIIVQTACSSATSQEWAVSHISSGYYRLINGNSNRALDVSGSSSDNGADVIQYLYNGGSNQLWEVRPSGNAGYYVLINQASGKALDVWEFSTASGGRLSQYDLNEGGSQLFDMSLQSGGGGGPPPAPPATGNTEHWSLSGNLFTHDPTIFYESGTYWIFYTARGIGGKYSSDGRYWQDALPIFPNDLGWWRTYVPDHRNNDVWAPDLKAYGGRVHMYYSISTFGSRVSAIGLVSASSVQAGDWSDQGMVIRSTYGDNWNAIDPDLVIDASNQPWLVFGSWNSGIKLRKINPSTMKPTGGQYSLASKGGGAIEAPCIVYRAPYYYLFVSIDICCEGLSSTYKIVYGRSTSITGTYRDKNGVSMMSGGGSLLDGGNTRWIGPGGQDILGNNVIARHAYDSTQNGLPQLLISNLNYDSSGWPKY